MIHAWTNVRVPLEAAALDDAPARDPARPTTVLVVENDVDMNRRICDGLADEHRVVAAFDGSEGLNSALELAPDLLLTALIMPTMTGEEFVHAVRSRRELDTMPVFVLTSKVDDELRLRLFRAGVQDYMTKPFAVEELRIRVRNLVTAKRGLEAKARLATLLEQAPDGVFVSDLGGRFTDVNDAACRMLGFSRDELLGMTIVDLLPPEDVERLWQQRERLLAGQLEISTWTVRRKGGDPLPVEVSAKILPDGRWQALMRDITERKRLERELREREAELHRAEAVAETGIWRLDVQKNELVWSDEVCRIFGVANGEPITYEAFLERVHPDDRSQVDERWTAAMRGGPYEIEHRIVVDGDVRWVREQAELETDERGTLKVAFGTVKDITRQKAVEEALRQQQGTLAGIIAVAADAIISIDADSRIVLFNGGAEQIFGWSKAEVLGKSLDVLLPERSRAVHREQLRRFAAGPPTSRPMGGRAVEISGLRKSGVEFPAQAAISKTVVGDAPVLAVVLRDITEERRHVEEQETLADIGAALQGAFVTDTAVGAVVSDVALRHGLADACLVDLVEAGRTRRIAFVHRDPVLKDASDRLAQHPLDWERPHLTREALTTGRPTLMRVVAPDGLAQVAQSQEYLQLLSTIAPGSILTLPLIARGEVLGAFAFLASQPGRYGDRELAMATEIARRAALAIDNARLFTTAQRAIAARERVLGMVAHDLRNPLSALRLQGELLRRRGEPERRSERPAAIIARSVQRMEHLIQEILDVTRLEGGALSVATRALPVGSLVVDIADAQRPLAEKAGLELAIDVAPDLPDVWGDQDQLDRVFENLIGNATKFTRRGGRITLGASRHGDDEVLFRVSDTGAGIAAADLPHLFEQFWQGANAKHRGAGMGLLIAKGIIEAHGGRIWVESTIDVGSTFFITLPVATHDAHWGETAAPP
ncbi:MAG: PAS domain S-box protein [Deltaproteobacteria bacterium]|nr:PAS domain S-box protein [Deltaproteobacteria bacterium]